MRELWLKLFWLRRDVIIAPRVLQITLPSRCDSWNGGVSHMVVKDEALDDHARLLLYENEN